MELEYFRIHGWLSYHHGKAMKCENELCESINPKRFEWALLKGRDYLRDRNNFIQLCPSCHRKYDYTNKQKLRIYIANKGKPAKNKRRVILNNITVFESLLEASNKTGVSITAIHNNIKGLSKLTKIGKWNYKQMN